MQQSTQHRNSERSSPAGIARPWRTVLAMLVCLGVAASSSDAGAQPSKSLTSGKPGTSGKAAAASKGTTAKKKRTSARRSARARRSSGRASSSAVARELANFAALRGSRPKVQGTYFAALNRGVPFYGTMDEARAAITAGKFVPLYGNQYYATYRMTLAYATPEAKAFIEALAPQFVEHCDEMMVVTSALRPKEKSPRNGSPWTVHPAGIAVDIRKPRNAACKGWLRQTLLDYQNQGYVDATEEFHPPHFHVAVIKAPPMPTRVVTTSNGEVTAVVR